MGTEPTIDAVPKSGTNDAERSPPDSLAGEARVDDLENGDEAGTSAVDRVYR
jgi:hypothetical protein